MSKVKKIIAVIVCVVCIFAMFCISTSASTVYTIPINQPRADDYSGYIEYLIRQSDGSILPFVTFWHITGSTDNSNGAIGTPSVDITVTNNRILLSCSFISVSSTDKFYFSLVGGSVNGYNSSLYWNYGSGGSNFVNVNAYIGSGTVVGYKIYGNFKLSSDSTVDSGSLNWSFLYSENSILYETLLAMAQSSSNVSSSITQNATENAEKIQENQNDNTDKIIENQQQIQENEKNEAESSGQGSVDDVSGSIEDKSSGFISAISSLVGSMSYNGTACAWSFPALKLPSIEGLMPEYQLTEEKPIDFEFWVNKIPSDLLLLVRSLLTIALIGYCFKELYGTISYVLTLKGGGNNE